MSISATSDNRRSQLYRHHQIANASLGRVGGHIVVNSYRSVQQDLQQATNLGLADLSTLPRTGLKGRAAPDWAAQQGAVIPDQANQALTQTDTGLIARLSAQELLVLSDLHGCDTLVASVENNWSLDTAPGAYLLPRADSHCWLALSGEHCSELLSKVCAVDMRLHKFANRCVAQTSVARSNTIVIRNDLGSTPCFYLLCDISGAEFMWHSLLDAMLEFQGAAVGLQALQQLQTGHQRAESC